MSADNSSHSTEWENLLKQAIAAREYAYAPYSNYKVGAALLTAAGKIYQGCNIENAAYSPSNCAERTAIFKAVSEGERDFKAIAVVTNDGAAPCGVCRQVIREFAPQLTIIIGDAEGHYEVVTLPDILPHSFGPENLFVDPAT
jgi:cytidine deaminase